VLNPLGVDLRCTRLGVRHDRHDLVWVNYKNC
jgi:hypothetical protein